MTHSQSALKAQVAQAAVDFLLGHLQSETILGIGTGSTVDCFIDALATHKSAFKGAVSSSERSTARLEEHGIRVFELNEVDGLDWYIDGADEITPQRAMTKGGGGALTREKIVASVARHFLCIVDESKVVDQLGAFPLPIEVVPMAKNSVARQLSQLGGRVVERGGFVTDNGGLILDVHGLAISDPLALEKQLNDIPGVVCCGIFALQAATVALIASPEGIRRLD